MWGDNGTVLVVDDDRDCRELHRDWLRTEYTVETAADGEAALDRLHDDVGLIVLDREMPGLSGPEVLERLTERGYGGYVLMVTGVEPDFELVDMPVDDYLVKPVSRGKLLGAIDRLEQRAGYHDQLRELFSLAAKKARLEVEKPRAELADSEEYERLTRTLERKRIAVGEAVADSDDAWLTAIEACLDSRPGGEAVASPGHEF